MLQCSQCNRKMAETAKFCTGCGASLADAIVVPEEPEIPKKSSKKKVLWALVGLAAIALIVLIVCLVLPLFAPKNTGLYSTPLYVKADELYYSRGGEPIKLTSDLTDNLAEDEKLGAIGRVQRLTVYNDTGRRVFFPDKMEQRESDTSQSAYSESLYSITLCWRDLNDSDGKTQKVADDVVTYKINPAGTKVIYWTADNELYISDLKEEEKIDSEVEDFRTTEDLKKVLFVSEGTLYLWKNGEKKKIDNDVARRSLCTTEDLSVVYYEDADGYLFCYTEKTGKKEKLAESAYTSRLLDSGALYYTVVEKTSTPLLDAVRDPDREADQAAQYPETPTYPVRPYSWQYTSDEAYQQAWAEYDETYDRIKAEYEAAVEAYQAAQERESLRQSLQDTVVETWRYDLYYFDGEEKTLVVENMAKTGSWLSDGEHTVYLAYIAIEQEPQEPVMLSALTGMSAWEAESLVESQTAAYEECLLVDDQLLTLEAEVSGTPQISESAGRLYLYYRAEEELLYNLYQVEIRDGALGDPCLVAKDVWEWQIVGDTVAFIRSVLSQETQTYELYVNGDRVATEVYISTYGDWWELREDYCLYVTEYDEETFDYTLHIYRDGKSKVLAEETRFMMPREDGSILYTYDRSDTSGSYTIELYRDGEQDLICDDTYYYALGRDGEVYCLGDYSRKHEDGTLYRWDGKKLQELDDEVQWVLQVNNSYIGSLGSWYFQF